MVESRFNLGQVLGIVVGVVALVGATSLAGGVVGYQLGKADGQSLARAEQRFVVDGGSGNEPFNSPLPFGGFGVPQPLPSEGEIPREFSAPIAFLGVRFESVNEDLAKAENLGVGEGAILREVVADSPAAQAGLQVGDVITAVDGAAVDAAHTLRDRVAAHHPGDSIELAVLRGGETLSIRVTLGERQDTHADGFQFRAPNDGSAPFFFGVPSDCLPRGEQG